MTTDLPELKYLDEAARAAGWESWQDIEDHGPPPEIGIVTLLARTLQKLAELEAENARMLIELHGVPAPKNATKVSIFELPPSPPEGPDAKAAIAAMREDG